MADYTTRRTNAGFELQVAKVGSHTYARVMYGERCAAKWTNAPLTIGLRDLYARFTDFDFNGIMDDPARQQALRDLVPAQNYFAG